MNELDSWNRKWRTLWCWTHIYVHYKRAQIHTRNLPEEIRYAYWNNKHYQFAELIWRNISELREWWIKVGQFLSTRGDLFPKEYVTYLGKLQDMMPWMEWNVTEGILRKELDPDLDEIFKEIQRKPIAAASIAQVHRAILNGGENVVIKIQYPDIQETLNQDMKNLEQLTWAFGLAEKDFDFISILNEWQNSATKELDFKNELKNQERAYKMFKDSEIEIMIPKVYSKYSNEKILTMEYIQGFKIIDKMLLKKFQVNKKELLETLCDSFAYQIHIEGFFHGDPQPSNIFVVYDQFKKKYIPALLDWGVVQIFDKKKQIAFSKMVYSLSTLNLMGFIESFEEMGFQFKKDQQNFKDPEIYMDALRIVFKETDMDPIEQVSLRESGYAAYKTVTEFSYMKSKKIEELNSVEEWPKDLIFFVRIISLIHGICLELNESIPLLKILSRRAQQFLYEKSFNLELSNPLTKGFTNKYERRLNDYIEKIMKENDILGLQVSVIKNGKNLAIISKGNKGELNGNKIDENTLFNGFFINLGILVIAILICVERGYISLDDPICHYWDGFIRYGKRNITLRHVLNHRSGVISFFPEDFSLNELLNYENMMRIIEDSAPQIPINHITRYNPYFLGWVLSELITLITNQPTTKFIEENIINPLGLQDGIKIYIPECNLSEEINISMSEEANEKSVNNNSNTNSMFLFPLFSPRSSTSSLKDKLENGTGGQIMNEIKEIIIQKLTPERMKKREKESIQKQEETDECIYEEQDWIWFSDRYAMISRRMNFPSISFKNVLKKFHSSTFYSRRDQSSKLSTLECFYLKPYILDPLIYNSKNLINKWIPPTNGKYTSLSLAKLYAHLSKGDIITNEFLKEITKGQSIMYDHSIEGLILTYGGPRKWSLGFQILECSKINNNVQQEQMIDYENKSFNSCLKGIGHSDTGGNLSFCFPEIDLSIAILTNDYVKGSYISQLILRQILKNFGLYLDNYVPLLF
ncbi:esterase of beta-lactamase [Cryptosporidium ubiquitum]|uniref:Esterase of beta-lactamase n=1 Tax=Cryptosporidium ubiquitum TaxID=857276 RepID=A0A1J4MMI6_9CRYT|nr:esterase of beta-lactamase [Cryptosporidium ubiquitum]OII75406.1 esterase of beta-lactamase [Cryptosporidium ubiquitum]